jgi:hypothetical protein
MHGSINVNSPNNTSKWQMGFNSAFKGLNKNTKMTIKGKRYNDIIRVQTKTQDTLAKLQAMHFTCFK